MSATYAETIRLAFTVIVLFVAAGIALWMRGYRQDSAARPVTLSDEVRSALRQASEAKLHKAREEKRSAKSLEREARRAGARPPA